MLLVADVPWLLAPAAAIFLTVLAMNLLVQATRTPACTIGGMSKPFAGIFTPIVTPFTADDDVDEGALRRNVARWMKTPLTGLVVLGSNGEAAQLDDDEADRVDRRWSARECRPSGRSLPAPAANPRARRLPPPGARPPRASTPCWSARRRSSRRR